MCQTEAKALIGPTIDATMTPDDASNLREPIKPRSSSRPRCTMLLRLVVGYAVDEHHSATCLH
jgi:hypothetical protein